MSNNFETAYAARAADLGMTEDALYSWEEALSDEYAEMEALGFPNLDVEDRPVVSESDIHPMER